MSSPSASSQPRRAAFSAFLGTAIEYYDFFIYGTLAALLFNEIFFHNLSPTMGTIAALATLAAGYVARFAGAMIFGHYGDRLGRKTVLMTTLIVMGLASGLIGLLPTQAQIGAAAPLILLVLRIVQGVAVGGEFGGAVLVSSEHSRAGKRGLAASAPALGAMVGALLATATVLVLTSVLDDAQLLSWGWRIPFLIGFALLLVAIYVRSQVDETPVFEASAEAEETRSAPVLELVRTRFGSLVKGIGLQLAGLAGQGVFTIYLLSYAPTVGYTRTQVILTIFVGSLLCAFATPAFGALSDRIGRRPVVLWGSIGTAVLAFPLFTAIHSGNMAVFMPSVVLYMAFVMTAVTAGSPALLAELFPTSIRYTGVSLTYQVGVMLGAGFGPLVAASLIAAADGSTTAVSWLLVGCGLVSVVSLIALPETRDVAFGGQGEAEPSEPASDPSAARS